MSQPSAVQIGTVQGLNTYLFSCPDSASYVVSGTLELPTAQFLGTNVASGVISTIKHNSTTIYTSNPGDKGFTVNTGAVSAGDTISVILSSSVAQDAVINAVKCTVNIYEGGAI